MSYYARLAAALAVLTGCSAPHVAPTQLSGHWGGMNIDIHDSTVSRSVVIAVPCKAALFPAPIPIEDDGNFAATGIGIDSSTNLGIPLHAAGKLVNGALTVDISVPDGKGGWGSPMVFEAAAGRSPTWSEFACTA